METTIARQAEVIAALRGSLTECADDLAAEIENRYSHGIKEHPAMKNRYERDMAPIVRAREILAKHHDAGR